MNLIDLAGKELTGESGCTYWNVQVHIDQEELLGKGPHEKTSGKWPNEEASGKESHETKHEIQPTKLFFLADAEYGKVFLKPVGKRRTELDNYLYLQSRNADHPALMPLEDFICHQEHNLLVFPYISFLTVSETSVTLWRYMHSILFHENEEKESIGITMCYAIADFLDFFNRYDMLHLDMKPENVLCCPEDNTYPIRIFDLECARIGKRSETKIGERSKTEIGKRSGTDGGLEVTLEHGESRAHTPHYSPPEVMARHSTLTPHADSYSAAAICYDMFMGPRQNISLTPYDAMKAGKVPECVRPILAKCFDPTPHNRYTPGELRDELLKQLC